MCKLFVVVFISLCSNCVCALSVTFKADGNTSTLTNGSITLNFDHTKGSFNVSTLANGIAVGGAKIADRFGSGQKYTFSSKPTDPMDSLGKGLTVTVSVYDPENGARWDFDDTPYHGKKRIYPGGPYPYPHSAEANTDIYTYTIYEAHDRIKMGFGVNTPKWYRMRLREGIPMLDGVLFPGKKIEVPQTLNGAAGTTAPLVRGDSWGMTRSASNSLFWTALVDGKRQSVVLGGLAYEAFGCYVALVDGKLSVKSSDPTGVLVDPSSQYRATDTIYLDVNTAEPFIALETYGRAMRVANNAKPNVYDFPLICGWGIGALSNLPDVNNSPKLVAEMDAAVKAGITAYTPVGIRLEPDYYCYGDNGNTQQGWWDDKHWAKYNSLRPPYETMSKWCKAIKDRGGIPYTYFQVGMPSHDFERTHPQWMLFNSTEGTDKSHMHHQPYVTYDYTDKDFQAHMLKVWTRLRKDGMHGIKFDYPETGYRLEGGFDNPYMSTVQAYRKTYQLCREGLGPDAVMDERNIGESGRPCLDVTAGIVDTQRTWTDTKDLSAEMITIDGNRWWKNRTVFNYYPDSKILHGISERERKAMLTMVYLTSGRIELATSFTLFTPQITRELTRLYPAYREPITARPIDIFTAIANPQVYDLELNKDTHHIALFNTTGKDGEVSVPLSGERVKGTLGLLEDSQWHAYAFWSDSYMGIHTGKDRLARTLKSEEAEIIALKRITPDIPQILSTNRHILQGWMEVKDLNIDTTKQILFANIAVVKDDPVIVTLALNGKRIKAITGGTYAESNSIVKITIPAPATQKMPITLIWE